MKDRKSSSQLWLESEQRTEENALKTLNRYYMENIIFPYIESEKTIDMHTHTNHSDGDHSPIELVEHAIEKRVGILGITDHDTIEGIKMINREDALIKDSGITIIDGIELSAKANKGIMHILGYDIDKYDERLNAKTKQLKDIAINAILSLIEILKKDYDIVFGYDDIKELINANHNLGRPDLAKLCIKNGYANTVQEAFDKYLIEANKKIGKRRKGIPYEECFELILNSGGIPVLAHPKTLELSEKELLIFIRNMIDCGLQGIEVYHSNHTEEDVKLYLDIANKYNLLISGGSDYHGPTVKPNIELGSGKDHNLKIKSLSLLDHIKK